MRLRLGEKKREMNQIPHTKLYVKNNNNSIILYSSMSVIDTLKHQKCLKDVL